VYINGRGLIEPYIREPPDYVFKRQRVPPNSYFVLGDNRNDSYDSSRWTSTPWLARKYIIGKAWIAYWPPSEFQWFRSPSISLK
jgi:signal peptidase I